MDRTETEIQISDKKNYLKKSILRFFLAFCGDVMLSISFGIYTNNIIFSAIYT